jgi:hypothetical protein
LCLLPAISFVEYLKYYFVFEKAIERCSTVMAKTLKAVVIFGSIASIAAGLRLKRKNRVFIA